MEVVFWIDAANAPYVITKPLHHTQKLLREEADGKIFSIRVILNFELERELLGFGAKMRVLGPRILVKQMKAQLLKTLANYNMDNATLWADNLNSHGTISESDTATGIFTTPTSSRRCNNFGGKESVATGILKASSRLACALKTTAASRPARS